MPLVHQFQRIFLWRLILVSVLDNLLLISPNQTWSTATLAGLDLAVEANEVFSGGWSWLKIPVLVSTSYYNLTVMSISMLDLQHKFLLQKRKTQ